ncbi:hypothetical protein Goklo_003674, partial [Gossypium klotzschianum]|nr:hypothetical protein [Gossypium klotzschianum]
MAATITASSDEGVKIVIINTQYVETDPLSFKSVVQRLTGKESCVSWIEESSFPCSKTQTNYNVAAGKVSAEGSYGTATVGGGYGCDGGGGCHVPVFTTGLSFKDLDRLILEAPPLDELSWLLADIFSSLRHRLDCIEAQLNAFNN